MIQVHKAVEPSKLTKAGKVRLAQMLTGGPDPAGVGWVLPKYDGVYAQYLQGEDGAFKCYSRTGERLLSGEFPEALEVCRLLGCTVIGELWHAQRDHSWINGEARRQCVSPTLHLVVHDAYVDYGLDYMHRWSRFSHKVWTNPLERVDIAPVMVVPTLGRSLDSLYKEARQWRTIGPYDGLILRDPLGLFVPGSGTGGEIIKIKPRASGDFRVVGTTDGIGNRAGGIGALVVDLGGGVTCEVGSGLTAAHVAAEPSHFIGSIVEVEYLSLTKDGKLREPSFKGRRFDKATADVLHGE